MVAGSSLTRRSSGHSEGSAPARFHLRPSSHCERAHTLPACFMKNAALSQRQARHRFGREERPQQNVAIRSARLVST